MYSPVCRVPTFCQCVLKNGVLFQTACKTTSVQASQRLLLTKNGRSGIQGRSRREEGQHLQSVGTCMGTFITMPFICMPGCMGWCSCASCCMWGPGCMAGAGCGWGAGAAMPPGGFVCWLRARPSFNQWPCPATRATIQAENVPAVLEHKPDLPALKACC